MIKDSIGKIGDLGCAIELPEETPNPDDPNESKDGTNKKEEE